MAYSKYRKKHRKLVDSLGSDFSLGLYSSDVKTRLPNLPFLYYPDFRPFLEANIYIIEMARKGFALSHDGGTIKEYAYHLSFLSRFLHANRLEVMDLTHSRFELFIKGLQADRTTQGDRERNDTRVHVIGVTVLEFMEFVTKSLFFRHDFVSENGILRAYKESNGGGRYGRSSWVCNLLPTVDASNPGSPVSPDLVLKLKAVAKQQQHPLRKRDDVIISALEHTGGRRGEVGALRASDVLAAFQKKNGSPLISMVTLKRDDGFIRKLPVSRVVLSKWADYISSVRLTVMHKNSVKEHDMLFINLRNGQPLNIDSIGNIIDDLRGAAGIKSKLSCHMFRHRFITDKIKELIYTFDVENKDVLRRALISSSYIKEQLQQWTGHKIKDSLDRYIHLAFGEISGEENVRAEISIRAASKASSEEYLALVELLRSGKLSFENFVLDVEKIAIALWKDAS